MGNISINIIESSSNGNCILLNDGLTSIFLDFGSDYKNIKNSLNLNGLLKKTIVAALITHEHIDHTRSINNDFFEDVHFYLTKGTHQCLNNINRKFIDVEFNKWVKVPNSNWKFKAFPTLHNANESACFLIKNKRKSILYLTDTRYFVNKKFKGCNCYIIESNYGCEIIESKVKSNIHNNLCNRNHLNLKENEQLFHQYTTKKTKLYIMSHLSSKLIDDKLINLVTKKLQEKNRWIKVEYIDPNKINFYKWVI